jgi:hypothetical protein
MARKDRIILDTTELKKLDSLIVDLMKSPDSDAGHRVINNTLRAAGKVIKEGVQSEAPQSDFGSYMNPSKAGSRGGKVYRSRIHDSGALRRSIKASVKERARPNNKTFIAAVYARKGGVNPNEDGWHGVFAVGGYGQHRRKNNFMKRGLESVRNKARAKMTGGLEKKIVSMQKRIIKKHGL